MASLGRVYYGQNFYDTFDDAIGAIFSDEFVESDATAFAYPFSSYLILKGDTTDLTNTAENKIVQAGLFRNTAGGGGAGGGGIPGGQDTQIQFNNAGVFDGEPEFTFNPLTNIVNLTGSMIISGAISASYGPNTVGFYGTASWAVSASQAISSSYAFSASYALSSSRATTASYALTASRAISASYAPDTTFPYTGSAIISGSLTVTGSTNLYNSGSTILSVSGSQGGMFSISDDSTGDLLIVQSGSNNIFIVSSSGTTTLSGSLTVTQGITGSLFGTAS